MAYKKDPNATLDYSFDWSPYLSPIADTITTVEWVLSTGLTKVSESFTTTSATVFVLGGIEDEVETITCRITTAGGRIDDRRTQHGGALMAHPKRTFTVLAELRRTDVPGELRHSSIAPDLRAESVAPESRTLSVAASSTLITIQAGA